jgi:hypothetical protein
MKVLTYATHSYGKFDEIVGNPFGVKVDVIGFGTKWGGFMDKIHGVLNYLGGLPDNEIVVFIDGFDSEIVRPIDNLENIFKSFNCKVLISKDPQTGGNFVSTRIFGTCTNDGQTANSGLYMGEVKFLKIFLKSVLKEGGEDDQRNFNTLCSKYDWIKVDSDNKIFYNINTFKKDLVPYGVYFASYPASISFQRGVRGLKDYHIFFIREISLVLLIAALILFMWKM